MSHGKVGFPSIVFDCDSTLASVEGIDELAGPHAAEVRALTDAAMEGSVPLEEVYGRRLEIIQPTRDRVAALGQLYAQRLVKDARETVAALLWVGKEVRIISGGLRPPVEVLAAELGLVPTAVAAVAVEFSPSGAYVGYDRSSPLARGGGKAAVVRAWRLARPILFVGDGATDLEARSEVDSFAAYTGVAHRENVAAAADLVITGPSLAPVLALAATPADRERLEASHWADLLARADELLRTESA